MLDLLAQRITGMFFWYFVVWNPWRVRDLQGTQTCENNYTIALGGVAVLRVRKRSII